ncbi:helix-turn-helix domain-containing protein [Mucilaginibacter rubeus]|uniref:Helix-turn-helix transcriptional regulator n=1 Tax=Mucilaginibacter rubeus TaxID=2027860 RepID=A0A5C1I359_9SPHI|nr:helix-turn-helix transcriptional regulator [Mucilaginibacter rubeus]QEM12194.1 helix-turn-helix transcriptional regulator [Mucilaginibacter rubeus]
MPVSYSYTNFDDNDKELSNFAKALALPVRVAIIRIIIEHNNVVKREMLYEIPFNIETINKHVAELKNLGILKVYGIKGNVNYSIDESLFDQMAYRFSMLFKSARHLFVQHINSDYEVAEVTPAVNISNVMPTLSHFGLFISQQRNLLNITQPALAEKLGLETENLNQIERGEVAFNPEKLMLLANAFNIAPAVLKREYYSYRIAELVDESGCNESLLDSAKEKIHQMHAS